MNKPLVSVIIPTYNRKNKILKAIRSVLNQTYKNFELIIVDDNSTDNTKELIKKLMADNNKISYIKNSHKKGPSGARNQGIEIANGKYVAFLDSDDEWFKHHLEESLYSLEKHNLDVCTSLFYEKENNTLIDKRKSILKKAINSLNPIIKNKENLYIFNKNLYGFFITHELLVIHSNNLIIKKSAIKDLGGFNEDIRISEDTELSLRIYLNLRIGWIDDFHAIWNKQQEDSIFSFKNKLDLEKLEFSNLNYIKCRKHMKKIIKSSDKFKIKKPYLDSLDQRIKQHYKQLSDSFLKKAKINFNRKNPKAIKYYLGFFKYLIKNKIN